MNFQFLFVLGLYAHKLHAPCSHAPCSRSHGSVVALGVVTPPTTLDVSIVAVKEVFSECPFDRGPPIPWETEDVVAMKDVSILPTAVASPVTFVPSIEVITKVRIFYRQTSLASSC